MKRSMEYGFGGKAVRCGNNNNKIIKYMVASLRRKATRAKVVRSSGMGMIRIMHAAGGCFHRIIRTRALRLALGLGGINIGFGTGMDVGMDRESWL